MTRRRGQHLHVGSVGSDSLPAGWHDEIVCHTYRKNSNGTITVIALINLYSPEGDCYTAEHTVRLKKHP